MNAYELKEYIIENNLTEEVLKDIGCFNIKPFKKEFRCSSPLNDNLTALSIKKNSLSIKLYSSNNELKGDIFTLTMNIKKCSFFEAIKIIHEILSLPYTGVKRKKKKEKKDILMIFKKACKSYRNFEQEKLEIYNEDICKDFISIPYIGWVREGIMPYTQKVFNIGFSTENNRIVVPHRYWCGTKNDYVGVMGRTLNKDYKLLNIPKYFPLLAFPKTMNLYGLQENYCHIQEKGYVNVFEAEKSVLKRHSLLDKTGVALSCHEISDEQVKILISLNVDIIIQMDKDISLNFVRGLCEKFYLIRNVYYIYDEFGLLKDKESPADKHNKIYWTLWRRKKRYDEREHLAYLKEVSRWEKEKVSNI